MISDIEATKGVVIAGILSLLMMVIGFVCIAIFLVIAAVLIGTLITGLVGGGVLLFTGNTLSKKTTHKVLSRVCIVLGVIFLVAAGSSAGEKDR